ncbi:hypothetical protein [Arthrobacter sp. TMS1-12-1]
MISGMTSENNRQFLRVVHEFEVEITDRTTAQAYTMALGLREDGTEVLFTAQPGERAILSALQKILATSLYEQQDEAGFKLGFSSLQPRLPDGNGSWDTFVLAAVPMKRGDGTYDPSVMPGNG